jgi:hypothetical protein
MAFGWGFLTVIGFAFLYTARDCKACSVVNVDTFWTKFLFLVVVAMPVLCLVMKEETIDAAIEATKEDMLGNVVATNLTIAIQDSNPIDLQFCGQ